MINRYIDTLSHYRKRVIGGIFCLGVLLVVLNAGPTISSLIFLLLVLSFLIPRDRGPVKLLSELMALLNTGYTLSESLELLGHYQPQYKKSLKRITNDLRNGSSFVDACKRRLRWFPSILIRVIDEGEKRGALPRFIKTFLDYYDIESTFMEQRKNALTYPAIVFATCFFMGGVTLIFIFPIFSEMFSGFGKDLPLMTQISITLVGLLKYLVIFLLLIGGAHLVKKLITGRGLLKKWQVGLDVFLLTLFSKEIVEGGSTLSEALTAATYIAGYKKYIQAADSFSNKVKNGSSYLEALRQGADLPPDLVTAIASSHVEDDMPKTLGQYIFGLREQSSIQIRHSSRRLEFAAILCNIVLWGFVIISFYLPIFKMAEGF